MRPESEPRRETCLRAVVLGLLLALLTACSNGGGEETGAADAATDGTWDAMVWDRDRWQ